MRPTESMHTVCRIVLNIAAVVSVGTSLVAAGVSGLALARGFQAGLWQPVAGITDGAILSAAGGVCLSLLKAFIALVAVNARGLPWSWVGLAAVFWLVAIFYLVATLVLAVLDLTADTGGSQIPFVVLVLSSVALEVAAGTLPGLAVTNKGEPALAPSDEAEAPVPMRPWPAMTGRRTSAATADDVLAVLDALAREQPRHADNPWITASQRSLARRVGCSLSHVNHLLHRLAQDGVIDLRTVRRTRFRIRPTRVGRGTGQTSGADGTYHEPKTRKPLDHKENSSERSHEHRANVLRTWFPRRADAASDQVRHIGRATADFAHAPAKTNPS